MERKAPTERHQANSPPPPSRNPLWSARPAHTGLTRHKVMLVLNIHHITHWDDYVYWLARNVNYYSESYDVMMLAKVC